jgi:7-keto-8-aminopelargonate synthetase-like enzyme
MNAMQIESQLSKIYEVAQKATDYGVAHLTSRDVSYNGRELAINGKKHINFASCSYLGLALDERVIQGAVEGAKRYGTSFPTSRSFVTLGYLEELEEKLEALFGYSCIVTTSTSLAHAAFLPIFIHKDDVFICDHQVHTSVRVASDMVRAKGCKADIVRHNDIDKLEEKIISYRNTHKNIWYLADGIYSMYGDKARVKDLNKLLDTYENFHVYIDDAHGMSWMGKNGRGFVMSEFDLHPRMVLSTSLGKAFGSIGGVLVCKDPELKKAIKYCGSSFIFSSPIPPSVIGASIASAEIHLSPEIDELQTNLLNRINYFKELASGIGLPYLGEGNTPIFFIPSGNPDTSFQLSKKLMERGFYQSSAVYPSVPYNSGGMRLTLTNWLELEDIEKAVHVLHEERQRILHQENISEKTLQRSFKGIRYNVETPRQELVLKDH